MAISASHEDYPVDIQLLLLRSMISDPTAFARSQNILRASYFDDVLRPAAKFILDYSDEFNKLPSPEQIYATTKITVNRFEDAVEQSDWYLKTIEKFCRYRALELAVLDGVELIQKGEGAALERLVKDAMTISLMTDLGTSLFHDPKTRLERLKDRSNFIKTGWETLDRKLFGGFTPGSLNIWAGGSGSGKSLFLQNIALNWALAGMNVVYISLELSEDLVNLRLDAMVTGLSTSEILKHIDETALKVRMTGKQHQAGDLRVKKFPEAGTTCNALRAYLKEYEIKEGRKPDALVVDYLDLMHPNNAKIDVSSLFTKDKYVSEELRSIASEWGIPVVSASQLNRQSVEAQEFDHSHIAGGISKINTADNVFGIFTSTTMRERGEYQIQFLKTRSSSAVGQKISLVFDPISLRIRDPDNNDPSQMDGEDPTKTQTMDELREKLKGKVNSARPSSPEMTPPAAPQAGMSISQMAHPAGKSREQLEAEMAPAQASPLRADLASLIAKTRKSEN